MGTSTETLKVPEVSETGVSGPEPAALRVDAQFRVLSTQEIPGGRVVSEAEVLLGDGLTEVNQAARIHGGTELSPRIVLRLTSDPQGGLIAAESVSGESTAMAESLARQALSSAPRGTTAPRISAAGVAGWAFTLFFVGVTAYEYSQATPEEKPHVLAQAAGGFVGGAVSSYIVCNLALGIETAGWSLLICGVVAGVPGALAGGAVADVAYQEATIDDDEIRAWAAAADLRDIGAVPASEKIRMILSLMKGWISDDDVSTIERICLSVTSRTEMERIRSVVEPLIVSNMTDIGQRTRVRIAIGRNA